MAIQIVISTMERKKKERRVCVLTYLLHEGRNCEEVPYLKALTINLPPFRFVQDELVFFQVIM